jgi:O-acetylhomoserine/O-acetylserine sulfhydrylase-like pyridoxal-dependent enzyme
MVPGLTTGVVLLKKYGIGVKFVTSDDPAAFAAAIDEKTKAVYVESIGNPKYNVSPIREIAKVCDPYAWLYPPVLRCDIGRTRSQGPADR